MNQNLDQQRLEHAFQGRPDLVGAIKQAAVAPNWIELFNEITRYVTDLRNSTPLEPASKRRKIEDTALPINTIANITNGSSRPAAASASVPVDENVLLQIKDISVVIPQRKKYTLELTASHIRARHPDSNELIPGISYAWKEIAYAFCLPVPEKAQKQHNYILLPQNSNLPTSQGSSTSEPLVFTIPTSAPKPGVISGSDSSGASTVSDDYKTLFDWALSRCFTACGNHVKIIEADEKHFASVIKEAHRPNEKAVFVKGFRGSKDGYLFFLSSGILFGFKKPLLFLPKERIVAVSYTSVLQRTFNLNVEVYVNSSKSNDEHANGEGEQKEEFEFAMLDQEDFAGIDTYVKRHGMQDASMAEQRRAKRLGINVVKGEDGEKVDIGEPEELVKAQQQLQDEEDEEDEEEEDYNPGSEGESEGEGSSTDEDEDEDEDETGGGDGEDAEDDEGAQEEEEP